MVKKLHFFSVIVDRREDDSGGYIITLVSSRLPASLQPVQRVCPTSQQRITRDVCAFHGPNWLGNSGQCGDRRVEWL